MLFTFLIAVVLVGGVCFVVTVYEPDLQHFEPDLKTRIKGRKHEFQIDLLILQSKPDLL